MYKLSEQTQFGQYLNGEGVGTAMRTAKCMAPHVSNKKNTLVHKNNMHKITTNIKRLSLDEPNLGKINIILTNIIQFRRYINTNNFL